MDWGAILSLIGLLLAASDKQGETFGTSFAAPVGPLGPLVAQRACTPDKPALITVHAAHAGTESQAHEHSAVALANMTTTDILNTGAGIPPSELRLTGPAGMELDRRHSHYVNLTAHEIELLRRDGTVTVVSQPRRVGDSVGGHTHAVTITCAL